MLSLPTISAFNSDQSLKPMDLNYQTFSSIFELFTSCEITPEPLSDASSPTLFQSTPQMGTSLFQPMVFYQIGFFWILTQDHQRPIPVYHIFYRQASRAGEKTELERKGLDFQGRYCVRLEDYYPPHQMGSSLNQIWEIG